MNLNFHPDPLDLNAFIQYIIQKVKYSTNKTMTKSRNNSKISKKIIPTKLHLILKLLASTITTPTIFASWFFFLFSIRTFETTITQSFLLPFTFYVFLFILFFSFFFVCASSHDKCTKWWPFLWDKTLAKLNIQTIKKNGKYAKKLQKIQLQLTNKKNYNKQHKRPNQPVNQLMNECVCECKRRKKQKQI